MWPRLGLGLRWFLKSNYLLFIMKKAFLFLFSFSHGISVKNLPGFKVAQQSSETQISAQPGVDPHPPDLWTIHLWMVYIKKIKFREVVQEWGGVWKPSFRIWAAILCATIYSTRKGTKFPSYWDANMTRPCLLHRS